MVTPRARRSIYTRTKTEQKAFLCLGIDLKNNDTSEE